MNIGLTRYEENGEWNKIQRYEANVNLHEKKKNLFSNIANREICKAGGAGRCLCIDWIHTKKYIRTYTQTHTHTHTHTPNPNHCETEWIVEYVIIGMDMVETKQPKKKLHDENIISVSIRLYHYPIDSTVLMNWKRNKREKTTM